MQWKFIASTFNIILTIIITKDTQGIKDKERARGDKQTKRKRGRIENRERWEREAKRKRRTDVQTNREGGKG